MKRISDKTYDKEYELLLKGFECKVVPSENDGYYTVTIKENGAQVFEQEIPNVSQDLENESEEKVLQDVAQAAIDIFEAGRGTLGMGAGAKAARKASNEADLIKAVKACDIEAVKAALASGADPSYNDNEPIKIAFSSDFVNSVNVNNYKRIAEVLIKAGADPSTIKFDETSDLYKGGKRKKSMRKHSSYYDLAGREDWYMQFKGTTYEQQAYELLKQYIEASYATYEYPELEAANAEMKELEKQLELLDLERMNKAPMATKIIIINASSILKKAHFYDTECIRDYLAKFEGDPMEAQAVRLMKQFVESKAKYQEISKATEDNYKVISELTFQMDTLAMEMLSQDIDKRVPTEGIEAFPNMAGDIAELMQGVSLEEPLIPMSGTLASKKKRAADQSKLEMLVEELFNMVRGGFIDSYFKKKTIPMDPNEAFQHLIETEELTPEEARFVKNTYNSWADDPEILKDEDLDMPLPKISRRIKRSFQEVEPVADRIIEKGIYHNGQPAEAEVPDKDMYSVGDKVTLTKEFTCMNGMPVSIPKGTKGVIESLLDRSYECYSVRLMPEDSRTIVTRVPADILKKI